MVRRVNLFGISISSSNAMTALPYCIDALSILLYRHHSTDLLVAGSADRWGHEHSCSAFLCVVVVDYSITKSADLHNYTFFNVETVPSYYYYDWIPEIWQCCERNETKRPTESPVPSSFI
jgi:hypothetical protein